MQANWVCLFCHRSGEKQTRHEAEAEHRNALLTDANNNRIMSERHPGFVGPKTMCAGDIRLKSSLTAPEKPVPESGVLGGDDPWL
jgi:hypothetical protein